MHSWQPDVTGGSHSLGGRGSGKALFLRRRMLSGPFFCCFARSSLSHAATPSAATTATLLLRVESGDQMQCTRQVLKTHFGYRSIARSDKKHMVHAVFRNVATHYDVMNDLMSAALHRMWKDEFVHVLAPLPYAHTYPMSLLDVAAGTGDIAFRALGSMHTGGVKENAMLDRGPRGPNGRGRSSGILVTDINPSMLSVGQTRARHFVSAGGFVHGDVCRELNTIRARDGGSRATGGAEAGPCLEFAVGDAEALSFPSKTYDAYTIAFGIRNVTQIDAALEEAHRVLHDGGRFLCLEFCPNVSSTLLSTIYEMYSFNAIPVCHT